MIDDPFTYDLTEFAREFTWSILFWNSAELKVRGILADLLGGSTPVHSLVADMGSRSLSEALRSAARAEECQVIRDHISHFVKGYDTLIQYRNLYVHGLTAPSIGEANEHNVKALQGYILTIKGKGRMKSISQELTTKDMTEFKDWCLKLSNYGEAISRKLGFSDDTFQKMLEMPEPSLEKPEWPASPKMSIHYIQD